MSQKRQSELNAQFPVCYSSVLIMVISHSPGWENSNPSHLLFKSSVYERGSQSEESCLKGTVLKQLVSYSG